MTNLKSSICTVPGIQVGHAQNDAAKTGCTVILPAGGAIGGIDVRGSAPGTREVETLKPVRLVLKIDALLLTGGSAFGLDAAGGVQQFLEERGIGYDVGVAHVPIVPAAVIFDLKEGASDVRPDKRMGYEAACNASSISPQEGRVGAGRGATVGKVAGFDGRMKGGVGSCADTIGGVTVGVLAVVNALGDVVDPHTSRILAGARHPKSGEFINSENFLRTQEIKPFQPCTNTTLAVVATDAQLSKEDVIKVAQMAQDGLSRSIRPAHTPFDGDVVFALSVGSKQGQVISIGSLAAQLVSMAITRAVSIANDLAL